MTEKEPPKMTDKDEIKELIRKRGSYKGRITNFTSYLNGLDKKSLTASEVCELQLRLSKMELLYGHYDEVQLRLECLSDNIEVQLSERNEFESIYYKCISEAQNILSRNVKDGACSSDKVFSCASNNRQLVKLPTIRLPKFNGSYEGWLEFHDTYCSLIHSNSDIDDINKFHYLRASLEGTAALVIQSIEFSSSNYQIAWNLLCERFDNKRLLIQNHISTLFNIPPISKESSYNIKSLIDQFNKNLRALESLGEPTEHWDTLLIHMMTQKIDNKTFREWEELKGRLDRDKPITLVIFLEFLRNKSDLIETLELSRNNNYNSQTCSKNSKIKSMVSFAKGNELPSMLNNNTVMKPCPKCSGTHTLQTCSEFLALSNQERLNSLPNYRVCFNCFKSGHYANHCKKSGCKICKRKHNTLVHVSDFNKSTASSRVADDERPSPSTDGPNAVTLSCVAKSGSGDNVLLSTALIKLYDTNNRPHVARAVLDSGSTSCLITESLNKKLNLSTQTVSKSLLGINNSVSNIGKLVHVSVTSLNGTYSNKLFCYVLPQITEHVPSRQINVSSLNIPSDICLADPNFHTPSAVDIIIGADVFWDLLGSRSIKLGNGNPVLYETQLGWLVSGPINNNLLNSNRIRCNFSQVDVTNNEPHKDDIQIQLTRFWQLEEVSHKSSYYSEEEQLCENHFVKNTTRLPNGRFCVRIPVNQNPNVLGYSLSRVKQCLLSLERRLKCNPSFRNNYCGFMSEYLSLGHMSECKFDSHQLAYYIPHHGIIQECSTTTKLRVVFNASAPTSSGVSFNCIQMVGPTIQDDLLSILLRFRQHAYILAADIEKMYRQIEVHPRDRHLQQILWRQNPSDPIKTYQLNTVTYGTASAPFLAVRCLKQVGLECAEPEIGQIIIHDMYVDDLLSGGDTIAEVLNIKEKVTSALASACMPLRKFKSNAPELVADPQSTLNLNIGSKELDKTLGLGWDTVSDELYFNIKSDISGKITKRSILSLIGQIFDPMGLLSPCVISFKIMLQKLWLNKLSWDDDLPPEITQLWGRIIKNLPVLNEVRIPRLALCNTYAFVELHIFTDASQDAYGACAYLKSSNNSGDIVVRLILAKSRVAPIKPTTIPRLELCGALVGARLYEKLCSSLRITISHTYLWTDSMIVLGWLKMTPNKLQPFVRNRIADIHEITSCCTWRHVPTDSNPADLISRGVEPGTIQSSELWWCGPEFLKSDASSWPSKTKEIESLPEVKPEISLLVTTDSQQTLIDFDRFSNFSRLKRCLAYVLRFISRCKKQPLKTNHLNVDELQLGLNLLVRISQLESFHEYRLLIAGKSIGKKSQLAKFNVFLDDNNLMRVGGRLENSDFSYEKKHPLLIQSTHPFAKLLFNYEHKRLMHAAPQLLLATIREQFWPIGGRNLAKLSFHQCVLCKRMRGKIVAPIMGNLPQQRLSPSYPFESVGIDYAGPILAANRSGRGCRLVKVYVAIFICFATKAIHIELVGDLTSKNFLSSLRRFMSRRGKPKNIFSDNGTSFVGAYNEIGNFLKANCNLLSEDAANEGISFHFTPPYTPHFGGLWEAGVKSIKFHLTRVLGNCNLTYEELNTVLIQIEGLLNSRPLTPLSPDSNDLLPLTPAHFLIGRPLTSLPTANYEDSNPSRLSRYERIEQLRQHFWNRWSKEFIAELQKRAKWQSTACDLKLNSLVVLKEDHLPPLKWKLGRIIALYPGQDGVNRVADVKTSTGIIRRAFSKICPLLEDDQKSFVERSTFNARGHVQANQQNLHRKSTD